MARDLTVAQLEQLLDKKRVRLAKLVERRASLQRQLAKVEAQILTIGGGDHERRQPRRGRKRPKNTKTLIEAVNEILEHNRKGVTLKELAAKILDGGYKTRSANFENTVYQVLYGNREKVVHDPKTKSYRLK